MKEKMYELQLWDYRISGPGSGTKPFYGTLEDLEYFVEAIRNNPIDCGHFESLIHTWDAYKAGDVHITHSPAYCEIPFLQEVIPLQEEESVLENYCWDHPNTTYRIYTMRCERAKSSHIWLELPLEKEGRKYIRCIRTVFTGLQHQDFISSRGWVDMDFVSGQPHQVEFYLWRSFSRLYVTEKVFHTREELLADWENFCANRDCPEVDFGRVIDDYLAEG